MHIEELQNGLDWYRHDKGGHMQNIMVLSNCDTNYKLASTAALIAETMLTMLTSELRYIVVKTWAAGASRCEPLIMNGCGVME